MQAFAGEQEAGSAHAIHVASTSASSIASPEGRSHKYLARLRHGVCLLASGMVVVVAALWASPIREQMPRRVCPSAVRRRAQRAAFLKLFTRNHRDANERDLLEFARSFGAEWIEEGPLDGWLGWRGKWSPVEIKNPLGKNRLTDGQREFIALCAAVRLPCLVWRTADDVMRFFGARVGV
jgi:hypothetical protein